MMRSCKGLVAGLVAVCGVWGAVFTTPVLAAAPEVPEVAVESVASSGASFGDVLNPAATFPVEAGTYQFFYRQTKVAGCEGESKAPVPPGIYLGEEPFPVSQPVSALIPDSYYAVCLHAEDTAKAAATSTPVTFETAPEAPQTLTPAPITATAAVLHGVLDPDAKASSEPGTYEFLYHASAAECQNGEATAQGTATGASGQEVEVELPLGEPGELYTVCLAMTNAAGETTVGAPVSFRALSIAPKVILESTSVTEVTDESAILGAEVNPGGGATTYHFEYLTEAQFKANGEHFTGATDATATPQSLSIGADNTAHPAAAAIQGLEPGTVYRYRVVATNAGSPPGGVDGPEGTFTTELATSEFSLPDGRAWEQVSPVDKHGARIEAISKEGAAIAAAADGDAMTFVANSPTVDQPEGNPSLAYSQVMAVRGSDGGWSSRDIATPSNEIDNFQPGSLGEYQAFSPDLTEAVVVPSGGASQLVPGAKAGTEVFVRDGLNEASGAHYLPLEDGEYIVASNNLQHVILQGGSELYEWNKTPSGGTLTPISILPDEELVGPPVASVGDFSFNVRNAVSENGNHVFWETSANGETSLYMREVAQKHTVQLDLPQGQGVPTPTASEATFEYATPNGERVYFKDAQRLTTSSTAEPSRPELYEYDTTTGALTDLTPNPEGPGHESGDVQGEVIGAEDGGELYFVADGRVLPAGERNEEGAEPVLEEPNLYALHVEGDKHTTTFITKLSSEDHDDWETGKGTQEHNLQGLTSRVSTDGQYLAFMSELPLTGYDNHDAAEPNAVDEEVFEYSLNPMYDASTGKYKHITCVSCNPTGARPHGVRDMEISGEGIGLLVDRPELWEDRWIAGNIPGWTARHLVQADYQSRYLSNTGRLFFNSSDGLVPQDTNGKEDVYEYEPAGVESPEAKVECSEGTSSDSQVYVPEADGCVGLISSGKSDRESAFLDASESGGDVFFVTYAPLSPQDSDASVDVYDAHECLVASSPCASTATTVPPPCTTADSCKAAPEPQPAIFGAPASSTFSGVGNTTPTTTVPKKITKKAVKCKRGYVKKKNRCVRKKSKKKAKRASNDRRTKR